MLEKVKVSEKENDMVEVLSNDLENVLLLVGGGVIENEEDSERVNDLVRVLGGVFDIEIDKVLENVLDLVGIFVKV